MKLIGLVGKKRSGKDTVCKMLANHSPVNRMAFADELKHEVCRAVGCDIEHLERFKDNFRLILQGWGTEFRRGLCGDDYWIQRLAAFDNHRLNVITDVRLSNEVDFVRNNGGSIVRIVGRGESGDSHISETALDECQADHEIDNTGTLEDLAAQVKRFYALFQSASSK